MSIAIEPKSLTVEEFLEIPEDGISRELIHGEVRERGMAIHNRYHTKVTTKFARFLDEWLDGQPEPRGQILTGEAGFRLRGTKDSLVGIDLAYVSAALLAETDSRKMIFDGTPILAIEILSPSDKHEDIVEKIQLYLVAGVVVWEVDPDFRTVRVHRPGHLARSFNSSEEISDEPYLPGFRVAVSRIFGG